MQLTTAPAARSESFVFNAQLQVPQVQSASSAQRPKSKTIWHKEWMTNAIAWWVNESLDSNPGSVNLFCEWY